MGLFDKMKAGLAGGDARERSAAGAVDDEASGLFLFVDVPQAIAAEKALIAGGYRVRLVAPPARLRAGCDLAVELARVERPGAERLLEQAGAHTAGWAETADTDCAINELVTTVDFGEFLMVRAGNMKMTVHKATRVIVNTSGGGCPDIPYLNLELVGKRLDLAPRPKELGYTLCGLMLDRAFLECVSLTGGEPS